MANVRQRQSARHGATRKHGSAAIGCGVSRSEARFPVAWVQRQIDGSGAQQPSGRPQRAGVSDLAIAQLRDGGPYRATGPPVWDPEDGL
jgi:hypothetical protein